MYCVSPDNQLENNFFSNCHRERLAIMFLIVLNGISGKTKKIKSFMGKKALSLAKDQWWPVYVCVGG